jgi:hypothetical protein
MFVQKGRYAGAQAMVAWWPQTVQDVIPLFDQAPVVILWQCPSDLAPQLGAWVFQSAPFRTPLLDLSPPEEQLWRGLDAKSCRYEVRKAQQMDCVISLNEPSDTARLLINESIRRLSYRAELSQDEWQALLPNHDVFLGRWQGFPLAAHVLLRDPRRRARLLLSGSADRSSERFRKTVGPANRLLHWHELLHYKAGGYGLYDFGGCAPEKESPFYLISQFKLSFGGKIVEEPMVYLARNPALRALLRARAAAQRAVRKIPWPKPWIRTLRASPRLAALFR